ncbi:MAG: FAD binding domain-containing protein, partial [Planctomycetes bacterium]|nr:FAD binding domain-containing protein [Planctomycetota bacterium]
MKNFTYYRPATPEQAVRLLAPQWGSTELLAGGTDLLDRQKQYISQPDKVISLSGIKGEMDGAPPDLTGVRLEKGKGDTITGVTIGARTTLADIAAHAQLRALFPALTEAAGNIAGPQTRHMATLGGSLCQRNRCWYFRDEAVKCLLKGGDRCYALDGENQYHAIFTQGHKCVIASPTSLGPALIALDAQAHILGPKGPRDLELSKFFQAPTSEAEREHVLAPNEILLSVRIPNREARSSSYEVRHKLSSDWPLVQAAVAFSLQDGKASAVRIV